MRTFMGCICGSILVLCIFLNSVNGSWVKVWLEDGTCGEATFYSGDTVYFSFRAERDCNATIIMRTPWKKKILVENVELTACYVYRSYYDIGTGVTRSDWWKIEIEVKDGSGQEAGAECTFYVPTTKPTTLPPTITVPPTTPITPPPTTSVPATTSPPTTIPPTTSLPSSPPTQPPEPTLIQPTTVPPSTYPLPESPPLKDYNPLIYAGILSIIVIAVLVYLLMTKKP